MKMCIRDSIYTVYRQTWDQFLILLVDEFLCFVLFVSATAMVAGVELSLIHI